MRKQAFVLAACIASFAAQAGTKAGGDEAQFRAKLSKDDQVLHALDRLTFGPKPGDAERVQSMGLKKWIDLQLHPERIPESAILAEKLVPLDSLRMSLSEIVEQYPPPQFIKAMAEGRRPLPSDPALRATDEMLIERYRAKKESDAKATDAAKPMDSAMQPVGSKPDDAMSVPTPKSAPKPAPANLSPAERRKQTRLKAPQQVIAQDLWQGKLYRAIYSNRQLEQELDDFWYNHFNVFLDKGADHYLVPSYEREVIAPRAFGKFRDLLEATAKSPAMLYYLDNWQSVAPDAAPVRRGGKPKRGLNENYGRELLELHTLGVNGGYTQKDVIEVARCFTGWTIERPGEGGGFRYNDKVHDKGPKLVLGVRIPAGGGMNDGEKVLDILAKHPSTAHFISTKLAQRFVSDNPPKALVDHMAKTFLRKHGDIREVLKTMLSSQEFWSAGAYQAKVKTPFEMVVSSVRALNGDVSDSLNLAQQIAKLGQPLYRKQEPTGYSSANAEWVNSAALLGRMNFALALVQNKIPGVKVDLTRFQDGQPPDPARIARALLFHDASGQTSAAIGKALEGETPAPGITGSPLVAGLVIGSPDFQRK
jgi:uncharacterized protein (DUF1800 family)